MSIIKLPTLLFIQQIFLYRVHFYYLNTFFRIGTLLAWKQKTTINDEIMVLMYWLYIFLLHGYYYQIKKIFIHLLLELSCGSSENFNLRPTKLLSHFTCSHRPWFSIYKSTNDTEQWVQEIIPEMNTRVYKRLTNCKNSNTIHFNGALVGSSLFTNIVSVNHHSNPKRLAGHPLLSLFYILGKQSPEVMWPYPRFCRQQVAESAHSLFLGLSTRRHHATH